MVRPETKVRARALQLLCAAEAQGRSVDEVVPGLARLVGPEPAVLGRAEELAGSTARLQGDLDTKLQMATENWRMERLGVIDRNILRLGAFELLTERAPPKVVIDEALWLAHRFGTPQSPAFVNGVLDRVARDLGRL